MKDEEKEGKMMFVKVADSAEVSVEDSVEIPVEPEGHMLMSTLIAQFPGACGLKFKTESASWRGLRVAEDKLFPAGEDAWNEKTVYVVTFPKDSKRKGDDLLNDVNSSAKSRKIERKCVDLIVLGLPWKSTEEAVRVYFEQYGEVVLCEVKRDNSNNSKGFGFVRFKDYQHQCNVLGKKHFIDGRWCDVKIPNSQEPETSRKIFVGRLSESLTIKDLQDYFSQFGQVIDVYIPKPFRAFGFVTFVEADIAQGLCGESHIIKGCSIHVSRADPKEEDAYNSNAGGAYAAGNNFHENRQFNNQHQNGGGNYHHNNQHHHQQHYNNNNSNNNIIPVRSHSSYNNSNLSGANNNNNNKFDRSSRNSNYHDNGGPMMGGGGGGGRGFNANKYHHHQNNNNSNSRHKMSKYDSNEMTGGVGGMGRSTSLSSNSTGNGGMMNLSNGIASSQQQNAIANQGSGGNSGGTNGNGDQMNAMMNMFNPMMAAFLQQLATQSNGAVPPPHSNASAGGVSANAIANAGGMPDGGNSNMGMGHHQHQHHQQHPGMAAGGHHHQQQQQQQHPIWNQSGYTRGMKGGDRNNSNNNNY